MKKIYLKKSILFYTLVMTIFFPLKGLISFVSQYGLGYEISRYSGSVILASIFPFLFYVFLNNSRIKKTAETFFFVLFAFIGVTISLINQDIPFLNYVVVIFVFPLIFTWVNEFDESDIMYLFSIFFKITVIFILIEYFVINLNLFWTLDYEQVVAYQSSFSRKSVINIVDSRSGGGIYRTGGYLGNVLAMPNFILFSFIFFYMNYKIQKSYTGFFWIAASGISLLFSGSATATMSGAIAVLCYELFIMKNYRLILNSVLISGVIIYFLDVFSSSVRFTYDRFIININNPDYLNKFIGNSDNILEKVHFLLIGSWRQNIVDYGVSSHNDFIMVLAMFGIFPTYIVIRRWLSAIRFALKTPQSSYMHLYAMMLVALVITFIHHQMGLTVYPMIFGSIILLRIENLKNNFHKGSYS